MGVSSGEAFDAMSKDLEKKLAGEEFGGCIAHPVFDANHNFIFKYPVRAVLH